MTADVITGQAIIDVIMSILPLLIMLGVVTMLIKTLAGSLDYDGYEKPSKPSKPAKKPKVRKAGWGMVKATCPSCGKEMKIPKKAPFGHASEPVDCESCHASFRPYMVVGQ